jgi:hypothetical protein
MLHSQVHGLNTTAAAASPALFTGDSSVVGHLGMGHGMHSSDNLVGLGHSPLHGFPSASHDQVRYRLHRATSQLGAAGRNHPRTSRTVEHGPSCRCQLSVD